jgi:branched-chain amino acid transport system permease protein
VSSARSVASRYLRVWWTPLVLSGVILLTWLVVDAVGGVVFEEDVMRLLLWLMIVLGLQIFSGNSGVMSFGQIAFMGMGAYFAALLTMAPSIKQTRFDDMPEFLGSWILPAELGLFEAVLAAAALGAILAMIFGVAIARLSGVAAAIATLAILVIVNTFIVQTPSVTGGSDVVVGVPRDTTIGIAALALVVIIFGAYAFKQSRFGLRLQASRENEGAARSVAVNVRRERYIAFVLSAFVCGAGGAFYAHFFTGFAPVDFYFELTFITIAMLVVGGMNSVTGAVVGTYFLTSVYLIARRGEVDGILGVDPPSGTANLVVAVALLLALILRPSGITGGREVPWPTAWWRRRRAIPEAVAPASAAVDARAEAVISDAAGPDQPGADRELGQRERSGSGGPAPGS